MPLPMLGPYDLHRISEEPAEWGLEARHVWFVTDTKSIMRGVPGPSADEPTAKEKAAGVVAASWGVSEHRGSRG